MIRGIRTGQVRAWLPALKRRPRSSVIGGHTGTLGREPERVSRRIVSNAQKDRYTPADIRRQIEINREAWLDNARRSPILSNGQLALTGSRLAVYAVIGGLAAAYILADSLERDPSLSVTARSDIEAEPVDETAEAGNITLSKVVSP